MNHFEHEIFCIKTHVNHKDFAVLFSNAIVLFGIQDSSVTQTYRTPLCLFSDAIILFGIQDSLATRTYMTPVCLPEDFRIFAIRGLEYEILPNYSLQITMLII